MGLPGFSFKKTDCCIPVPDPDVKQARIRLKGPVPSALHPPGGCRFHTRCPRRVLLPEGGAICETEAPPRRELEGGHQILCHLSTETLSSLDPVIEK